MKTQSWECPNCRSTKEVPSHSERNSNNEPDVLCRECGKGAVKNGFRITAMMKKGQR